MHTPSRRFAIEQVVPANVGEAQAYLAESEAILRVSQTDERRGSWRRSLLDPMLAIMIRDRDRGDRVCGLVVSPSEDDFSEGVTVVQLPDLRGVCDRVGMSCVVLSVMLLSTALSLARQDAPFRGLLVCCPPGLAHMRSLLEGFGGTAKPEDGRWLEFGPHAIVKLAREAKRYVGRAVATASGPDGTCTIDLQQAPLCFKPNWIDCVLGLASGDLGELGIDEVVDPDEPFRPDEVARRRCRG